MSESTTSHQPTLLPADSLASLTVLPGSERAQQMTATSGRNLAGLLPNADPASFLLRTFLESSPPISTRCYLTWKVKRTPARRSIFQLAPSMPRIDGRAFSSSLTIKSTHSIPTPTASDHIERRSTNMGGPSKGELNYETNKSVSLDRWVKMWPTPQAHKTTPNTVDTADLVNSKGEPLQRGQKPHDRRTGKPVTTALADAVRLWPTPRANSAMAATITEKADPDRYPNLETVMKKRDPAIVGGHLNPTWVEWLMGLPLRWTEI